MSDRVDRFNSAVESFLQQHKLGDVAQVVSRGMISEFLADPAIGAYLTRPASDMRFDEKGEPQLESDHERTFYEACRADERDYIPYRAHQSSVPRHEEDRVRIEKTTAFYDSGTDEDTTKTLNRALHRQTQEQGHDANVFLVTNGYDTYQISGVLRRFQGEVPQYDDLKGKLEDAMGKQITLPDKGHSFLVFPSGRDAHAITFFAVLDNDNKKVVRTGLCNSWMHEKYTDQVRRRMNMDVSPKYAPDVKPFPLVDCSQHLQTHSTDLNCGLYRYNFAHALIEMLQNEAGLRDTLADPKAGDEQVISAVKEGLKPYLPQYYKRDGAGFTEAGEDEKRQAHLETRWEAGNAFIRDKIAQHKLLGLQRQ